MWTRRKRRRNWCNRQEARRSRRAFISSLTLKQQAGHSDEMTKAQWEPHLAKGYGARSSIFLELSVLSGKLQPILNLWI